MRMKSVGQTLNLFVFSPVFNRKNLIVIFSLNIHKTNYNITTRLHHNLHKKIIRIN